jgi:hypothetical protein
MMSDFPSTQTLIELYFSLRLEHSLVMPGVDCTIRGTTRTLEWAYPNCVIRLVRRTSVAELFGHCCVDKKPRETLPTAPQLTNR